MTNKEIIRRRMANHQLSLAAWTNPDQLVSWMGCLQAQDFPGAKWALGARLKAATDAGIQKAFNQGEILRTHILRPTWHLVSPRDIRWILALTAPRIKAYCAGMHRQLELNQATFKRSNAALQKALAGGIQLTRKELLNVFQQARIRTDELRLAHLLMQAELDGILCSGGMNGKQFTYALLNDRVPPGPVLPAEEATGQLALRYFKSRGPATLADFAWWSGLKLADARQAVESLRSQFIMEKVDGLTYWEVAPASSPKSPTSPLQILPAFDEYTVAYKERDSVLPRQHATRSGNGIFKPLVLHEGQVAGIWQRTIQKEQISVTVELFQPLSRKALKAAFLGYSEFMQLPVTIHFK